MSSEKSKVVDQLPEANAIDMCGFFLFTCAKICFLTTRLIIADNGHERSFCLRHTVLSTNHGAEGNSYHNYKTSKSILKKLFT